MFNGQEKHYWTKCKASCHLFYSNQGKKVLDYYGWFSWTSFRQGFSRVQARLDGIMAPWIIFPFLAPCSKFIFFITAIGLIHLPIMTSISVGHVEKSEPYTLFKINVFHLESVDLHALFYSIFNLFPRPQGNSGWILWWEETIRHYVNFMRGWVCMIAQKHRIIFRATQRQLEEVWILLQEDIIHKNALK